MLFKNLQKGILLTIIVSTGAFFILGSTAPTTPTTLTKKWEITAGLVNPESVIYDEQNKVYYVSNVNGWDNNKDGNGFISKINEDGSMNQLKWVDNLNDPKGIFLKDGYLYVADLKEIIKIDITNGSTISTFNNTNAGMLNDITVDDNGNIYVSDWEKKVIYKVDNQGTFTTLYDGQAGTMKFNGLYLQDNNLIFQNERNKLHSLDLTNNTLSTISQDIGDNIKIDGIWNYKNSGYFVSYENNNHNIIYYVDQEISTKLTTGFNASTADLTYVDSKNLLLVPNINTGSDKLIAYEVE